MKRNSTQVQPGISLLKKFIAFCFALIALLVMSVSSFGQTVVYYPPTAGTTWTVPAGVTSITVYCIGAGGGGGGARATAGNNNGNGGGGGGGGAMSTTTMTVSPTQVYNITLGAAGTGGAAGNNNGMAGGTTTFTGTGGTCSAAGGSYGTGAAVNTGAAGGAGGSTGTGTVYAGGYGGTGFTGSTATCYGGGGGGAGGSTSVGSYATATVTITGGSAGSAPYPGGAGANGTIGSAAGNIGNNYGGGGSGGSGINNANSKAGGNGAGGEVIIVYSTTPAPTITSFTPAYACTGTGTPVTITGTNFISITGLTINGTSIPAADYTVSSTTSITINTIPAGVTSGAIAITNGGGTATSSTSLYINTTPTPTFISPVTAICAAGGTQAYSVTSATGVTYTWSVTGTGWSVNGSNTGSSVTMNVGTGPATISVTPSTSCTTGSAVNLAVTVGSSLVISNPIPAAGYIVAGNSNVPVFGFTLTPNSCLASYNFTGINIFSGGSATSSDLSNFQLVYDVNSDGLYEPATDIIVSATAQPLSGFMTFSVTGQAGITTARNYLLIANVSANAVLGDQFSATLNAGQITAGGVAQNGGATGYTQTIEGAVTINAVQPAAGFLLQNTTNNPIAAYTVVLNGGASITPSSFKFTTGATGYTAGTDITNFQLWQSTSSTFSTATATSLQTIAAAGTSQVLPFNTGFTGLTQGTTYYFYITSDVPVTGINGDYVNIATDPLSNFLFTKAAVISGTNPTVVGNAQTIEGALVSITTQATPAAGSINQNTTSNPIASYQATVSNFAVTPTSFVFTTGGTYVAGTDVTNLELYVNTTNSITGATLLQTVTAPATGGTVTFNTGFSSLPVGTVYFIVTADVGSCATNAKTIWIKAGTANFANFNFTNTANSSYYVTKTGTSNPVTLGNTQTIASPTVAVTTQTLTAGTVAQGSTNNVIASYLLTASGGSVTPTSFKFNTGGTYTTATDFTNFQLWVNTSNNLGGATPIGSFTPASPATGGLITYSGSFPAAATIAAGSGYYFLITADVPVTGVSGDFVNIQAEALTNLTFAGCVVSSGSLTLSSNQTISGPVVAISTDQPAVANITVSSTNNIIAVYQLDVSNAASVTPTSLKLTTTGTTTYVPADFSNFKVYENTNATLSGATLAQTITTIPAAGGNVTFSTATGATFTAIPSSVTTYLIVTADVAAAAVINHTLDFTTTAFTNFAFTGSGGTGVEILAGTASNGGTAYTNPATASNVQTIVGPGVAISTAHPVAGNVLIGSINNLIASYKISVTNAAITPTGVTLVTGGTYTGANDVVNFYLYQNTVNSLTGATLVGPVAATGVASGQTLTFNSGFTKINAGAVSYLLLSADITGTATPTHYISINSSTASGNFTFNTSATVTGGSLAASYNQTIVSLLDVFWTGTNTWDVTNTNTDWWQYYLFAVPNLWVVDGRAHLNGTAGTITLDNGSVTASQIYDSTATPYIITSSATGNTITLNTPSNIYIGTGTTYAGNNTNTSGNPVFAGINGLTKTGAGELQIQSAFASGFAGPLNADGGTLTLGNKAYNNSSPEAFLQGNDIVLNNANLTIAAAYGNGIATAGPPEGFPQGPGCLENLTSVTSTGNSSITLYKTRVTTTNVNGYTTNYPYMGIAPTTDNYTGNIGYFGIYGTSITDLTPLKISGTLSVNGGGFLTGTQGADINDFRYVNYMAFGGVSLTGNTTFQAYASAGAFVPTTGTLIDIDLGGIGSYLTGVTAQSSQPINDSGFTMTFLGNGSSIGDGGELSLNAASSTMTGKWVIGDAAGTNAAWVLTNTGTCLSLGSATVNNYSKLAPKLTTTALYTNITYAPDTIYLYGIGPANVSGGVTAYYPGALDFFNFGTENAASAATTYTTAISSDIVLNTTPGTNLAGIAIANAAPPADFPGTCNLQLNGTVTGTGGLEKFGWGTLTLNAQNVSGNYNNYIDSTKIMGGILTVNYGSNLGTGPVVMDQVVDQISGAGGSPILNLNNTSQTIASLSSYFTSTTGAFVQTVNLNGCTLTDNQSTNTTYGNTGPKNAMTSIIAGTGNFIKAGAGTLTLTSANTYTGLTQVAGGTLALARTAGGTLPSTNEVDIIGGTLSVNTTQTLNNVILSSGTLNIASGVTLTITGSFTLVNGTITGGGTLAYSNGGTLIYAGSSAQTVNSVNNPVEWPAAGNPINITFDNFTYTGLGTGAGGVKLIAGKAIPSGGTATVNGWLDFAGNTLTGAGGFTLNGSTSKTYTGNTASGSSYVTNVSGINNIYPGMLVTGTGIATGAYITYIDTVLRTYTIFLNQNATAAGTAVSLTFSTRGGVKVSLPAGLDNGSTGHVQVTGTKTYNSGANYVFNTPTTGTQIYPGFPSTSTTFSPAWDVKINVGSGNNMTMAAGSNVEVADTLMLNSGVWATNTGLVTWDNPGTSYLIVPQATWAANNTAYTNSFIATCDNTGTPISVAGPTTPFTGTAGFKIKSVTNTDTYFPVGASYTTALAGQPASPNRMMLNNQYITGGVLTPEDFTVVINYGDIGFTQGSTGAWRVNRIWYVKTSGAPADSGSVSMKLYYTKRDWSGANWVWPAAGGENEIEAGYTYSQGALIEKDYTGILTNFTRLSDVGYDIPDFTNASTYPNNTEIYGQYTVGKSYALNNTKNGIGVFNRFSVVDTPGVILPVTVINFKAYQKGSGVQTSWTSLNEINMAGYEVERSANAVNFTAIGTVAALNNGDPSINYSFFDAHPLEGNNYYRIKIIGKDGSINYTNIEVVVIGGVTSSINIYPNPVVNHTFVLQMNDIPAGNYTLEIYSTLGQLILNQVISHAGGSASQTIQLPSGTARAEYQVRLFGTNMQTTKMINVQ